MYHFFVDEGPGADGIITIEGSDVHHMRDVLRMKIGEKVVAGSEDGDYNCEIMSMSSTQVLLKVIDEAVSAELPARLTLYQGLPKSDKMELIIQKAVELGAYRIVPVAMARSVVKLDPKKAVSRVARWQNIAQAAAKQSGRGIIPEVGNLMTFKEAFAEADGSMLIVPYENEEGMAGTEKILEELRPGMDVSIFIGPEGGFAPEEIEYARAHGAQTVSLGKRILRTETAGLVMLTMCMMKLELQSEN